jgi:hypothetical protein
MSIFSYNYVSFQLKKWTHTCHAKQWPTPPSLRIAVEVLEQGGVHNLICSQEREWH